MSIVKKIFGKIEFKLKIHKLKRENNVICGKNVTIVGIDNICFGKNIKIGSNCSLIVLDRDKTDNKKLYIGNNVSITPYSYVSCSNKIVIGDGCLLGVNSFVTDNFHGRGSIDELSIPPDEREIYFKGEVHIGKNVWLGRNTCVMPKVVIGDGAIVGANTVVTHDIPLYSVAAGCPAKIIKVIK